MSTDTTLNQIMHYQKKLEKYAAVGETEKILCCIHKLKYLPVTVAHLEVTGVGKSINNLRERKDIIGDKAKALVKKWKSMVKEEERQEYLEKEKSKLYTDSPHVRNEDEYDPSDEGDRLQIQEENIGEEPVIDATYNPTKNNIENEDENSDSYNPHTSREDYLSAGLGSSYPSYSPSSRADYKDDTSGESSMQNGNSSLSKKAKYDPHTSEENYKKKKYKVKSEHSHKEKRKSDDTNSFSYKKEKEKSSKNKDSKKSKNIEDKTEQKLHYNENKSPQTSQDDEMEIYENSKSLNDQNELKEIASNSFEEHVQESNHNSEKISKKRHDEKHERKRKEKERKSKKSKDGHKSSKRQKLEPAEMDDDGFGAALMGLDSVSPKKKKKKKSRERGSKDRESSNSTKASLKPNQSNLESVIKPLPELPASFEDELMTPQLMTHYKPLPYVPSRDSGKECFPKQMTDEEALNYMLTSKNNKQRRIYAGKASSGLSTVPSLFDICIRVLQENIDALEVTGGIPFDLLRPVLEKAAPQQLFTLEDYNPYLLEDTDCLWSAHCRKFFKNKKREDMETCREMFIRCTDENQEKMRSVTESLQKKYVTKAPPKRTTKLAYFNTTAKPPKSVARAQAKYGTGSVSALHIKPHRADEDQKPGSSTSSSSQQILKPDRPIVPVKHFAGKKPKMAPLMGKARQLMKKVCRR